MFRKQPPEAPEATALRPARARTRLARPVAILGLAILLPCFLAMPARATIVERIVAIVDQTPVLLTDLQARARPILLQVYASTAEGPQRTAAISQAYTAVLERIIEEELEDAAAAHAGVSVTPAELDEALTRQASLNNITVAELLEEATRSGLTKDEYRSEISRQLLQHKLASLRPSGRIRVDEADIWGAYQDLIFQERGSQPQRTARLVLPLGKNADEQAANVARAEQAMRKARAGENFTHLIREYGGLTGSGVQQPTPPAAEPKPLERASLTLEVGQVSKPIRVNDTLVILKLLERPATTLPPYEEAREALYQRVYTEKANRARKHWLDGLRRRTHIELRK
jgi:peptidyl-prolyl cis-trans isomerase SurA